MNIDALLVRLSEGLEVLISLLTSSTFYFQVIIAATVFIVAYALSRWLVNAIPLFVEPDSDSKLYRLRKTIYDSRVLCFPIVLLIMLFTAMDIVAQTLHEIGVIKAALNITLIIITLVVIRRYVIKKLFRRLAYVLFIPIALLHSMGWLDDVSHYLQSLSIELGNLHLSVYGLLRMIIFGSLLFWLGRISNQAGQDLIRHQEDLDLGTREVFVKLFQVILYLVLFLLLLQLMGINLTALAVFGGALGVGLGFGLQAIASNFISGIILLLDRSLAVGDFVEMEDGRSGMIRELNMRSTLLETYDGKDIMVPNEQFITTTFTNWTHKNKKQRYQLEIQVAYDTDLHQLFDLLREVVGQHPQVLSGDDIPIEERPDAEIKSFGDSGVNILIEYWMEGIDDGENRVTADLNLMIWDALKENNIAIPFPQREVRILNP